MVGLVEWITTGEHSIYEPWRTLPLGRSPPRPTPRQIGSYYARLYGLTRDELRYILDPKEVHGEDFPGETFRVLKEKEIKQFGSIGRDVSF